MGRGAGALRRLLRYGHHRLGAVFHEDRKDLVLSHYPHGAEEDAAKATGLMLADPMFASTLAYATCHLRAGSSTWMYVFDQVPPGPMSAREGAFHGAELVYAFDKLQQMLRPWTDADRTFAKTLQAYWTQFVKSGNPNRAGLPGWQAFDGTAASIITLRGYGPARALPTGEHINL